jgi:stearoyl-CoA desaturase (delta-9 desaturase)
MTGWSAEGWKTGSVKFLDRALAAPPPTVRLATNLREYQWAKGIPFFALHLLPLGALYTGAHLRDFVVCGLLYAVRMFGVTGGYHRYFSHRTYKTSRVFQFLLALLAQSSVQKGALWWAAHHRTHHKNSDAEGDPHDSRRGFWYSHVGWILDHNDGTDYRKVRDLAKYPELVFLNEFPHFSVVALAVLVYVFLGWSGVFIAFGLSTVLLWHGTFTINSLAHMIGKPRYASGDQSKNSLLLALITLGEGWHNNHHYFQGSTRQGFFWWEIDVTYYVIRLLGAVGLVWDIKAPPARAYEPQNFLRKAGAAATVEGASAIEPVASPAALPPAA